MEEFALFSALWRMAFAALAIVMVMVVARWWDRRAGKPFREVRQVITSTSIGAAIYYGARIMALGIIAGMVMGCAPAAAGMFPDDYDREIRRAVDIHWPDYPHPLAWKAQLWQESRLDPAAVSPAGARGVAQFMPGTWEQVRRELRLGDLSPHRDVAIEAGAYYMARLRRAWSSPRPRDDRHWLAVASYNAGLGHLLRAQERCGGVLHHWQILPCLPEVTGRHAYETLVYVERIKRWRAMMEAGL